VIYPRPLCRECGEPQEQAEQESGVCTSCGRVQDPEPEAAPTQQEVEGAWWQTNNAVLDELDGLQ